MIHGSGRHGIDKGNQKVERMTVWMPSLRGLDGHNYEPKPCEMPARGICHT
jgi:hypothetical protein